MIFIGILITAILVSREARFFSLESKIAEVTLDVDRGGCLFLNKEPDKSMLGVSLNVSPQLTPFFFMKVPVNDASTELLTTIPGIGPGIAARILNYRENTGNIRGPEDMLRIHGIGSKKLSALSQYIAY